MYLIIKYFWWNDFVNFVAGGSVSPTLEVIKLIGLTIGGGFVCWGLFLNRKRTQAFEKQVKNQSRQLDSIQKQLETQQAQLKITELGQVEERFKNALEHFANPNMSVCLGAIYSFYRISQEQKNIYREQIHSIFCAYIRDITTVSPTNIVESINTIFKLLFEQHNNTYALWKDLRVDFRKINLPKLVLKDVFIEDVDFSNAYLDDLSIENAILKNVNFSECQLNRASFKRVKMENVLFCGASMNDVKFINHQNEKASMENINFKKAILTNAEFHGIQFLDYNYFGFANMKYAKFTFVNMVKADFLSAYLENSEFSYVNMAFAKFVCANLFKVKFLYGVNALGADFHNAKLDNADMFEADLKGANFKLATLYDVNLRKAKLDGCHCDSDNDIKFYFKELGFILKKQTNKNTSFSKEDIVSENDDHYFFPVLSKEDYEKAGGVC